jgi:hypothetical protein
MRFKTWYDFFIIFTILIKIVYVILSAMAIYSRMMNHNKYKKYNKEEIQKRDEFEQKIKYWKDRVEFIFIANMAFILTYLFYPGKEKQRPAIDGEARFLLFTYGCLILLTAKWGIFFTESKWFRDFQELLGRERHDIYSNFFNNQKGNGDGGVDGDVKLAHEIINNNIETIATMNQFYDLKNQSQKNQNNHSYQRYYTNIYTPDTIGKYVYKPVQVPVSVNLNQMKSAI